MGQNLRVFGPMPEPEAVHQGADSAADTEQGKADRVNERSRGSNKFPEGPSDEESQSQADKACPGSQPLLIAGEPSPNSPHPTLPPRLQHRQATSAQAACNPAPITAGDRARV